MMEAISKRDKIIDNIEKEAQLAWKSYIIMGINRSLDSCSLLIGATPTDDLTLLTKISMITDPEYAEAVVLSVIDYMRERLIQNKKDNLLQKLELISSQCYMEIFHEHIK